MMKPISPRDQLEAQGLNLKAGTEYLNMPVASDLFLVTPRHCIYLYHPEYRFSTKLVGWKPAVDCLLEPPSISLSQRLRV